MGEVEIHVLMVTIAWQGHMNPLLNFAKRLVSKGIHVTFATSDVARHLMLKSNISTTFTTTTNHDTTPKNPARINLEFFSDGLSLEYDRLKNFDTYCEHLKTIGSRNVSDIITKFTTTGNKFSCIIINPFLSWVPDIAAEHGIPCAVLWIQACIIFSIYYQYFKHPGLFPSLENPNESVELPGLPVLQVRELPTFILPSGSPANRELISVLIQNLDHKIKWVLINSFNELEETIVNSMAFMHPIFPIGPLVSPFLLRQEESIVGSVDMWKTEDSCIEWLDKQPPSSVVYISFGSITLLSQKQMDNLAMGLKNSNQPFLWVIKPPDQTGVDNKFGELSSEFLEETKGRGLVVTWCPQEKVLMHQSVACFVTHCGWNSTIETVAAGVPVIAYPEWADQQTDAKLIVEVFKMGVRLKVDEDRVATIEDVERCIREITNGSEAEEMKRRALELKEAAKKAVEVGGSSDQNIDKFIREIIGESS